MQAPLLSGKRGFSATLVAMVFLASGCGSCDRASPGKIFYEQVSGARLEGPDKLTVGVPATFRISGQVGRGIQCPASAILSFSEDDSDGPNYLDAATAAIRAAIRIDNPATETVGGVCRLKPVTRTLTVPARAGLPTRSVTVTLQLIGGRSGTAGASAGDDSFDRSTATKVFSAVTSRGGTTGPSGATGLTGPTGPTGPTGVPPKADLLIDKFPLLDNSPLKLDARLSTDSDGTIVRYDFDFDDNGSVEQSGAFPRAFIPGSWQVEGPNRRITLTVVDNKGNTDSFTYTGTVLPHGLYDGDFTASPDPVAVNGPLTVTPVDQPGVNVVRIDNNDDGAFDGPPLAAADGTTSFPPFSFPTPGYKIVLVQLQDTTKPDPNYTNITKLVRVGPGLPSRARASAASASVTIRPLVSSAKLISRGRLSLVRGSIRVSGLLSSGRLSSRLPKRVPLTPRAALLALSRSTFAIRGDGLVNQIGRTMVLNGSATLLIRSRADKATQVCLRMRLSGFRAGSYSTLGATGKAKGLGASGRIPGFGVDAYKGLDVKSLAFTTAKGRAKALPASCRALIRRLPK